MNNIIARKLQAPKGNPLVMGLYPNTIPDVTFIIAEKSPTITNIAIPLSSSKEEYFFLEDEIAGSLPTNYQAKINNSKLILGKSLEVIDRLCISDEDKVVIRGLLSEFLKYINNLTIKDLDIYSVDDDSLRISFNSNNLDFYIDLFNYPEDNTEYLASIEEDDKQLFYKMGVRSDFKEIAEILNQRTHQLA